MKNNMKLPRPLWKTELLVYSVIFLVTCLLSAISFWLFMTLPKNGFMSAENFLRLFISDPLFLVAVWNTLKYRLLFWVIVATGVLIAKSVAFTKTRRISPALKDGFVYGLLFVSLSSVLGKSLSLFYGFPMLYYTSHTPLPANLVIPPVTELFSWVLTSIAAAPFALVATFILWSLERAVLYIIHYIRRRRCDNG